jgi:four helix bundle protein
LSKLTDADGEQQETQHWLETALDCDYIAKEKAGEFLLQYASIGKMLRVMMNKSEQFCK